MWKNKVYDGMVELKPVIFEKDLFECTLEFAKFVTPRGLQKSD